MDVVGSEIGQKMRSAIKAKLTELGCYVDDELPDYVMVMVANKRTRAQMEDDLQLFLGDNTELFVNWLHQVLKKLQEVTVTPLKAAEADKNAEGSKSKDRKSKEKKDKSKKTELKKAKKKEKEKAHRKKEEKKAHKSKKKSKHHDIMRPNVPPLLMNMEKESEPSITDVFAGQILKSHGFVLDSPKEEKIVETKPIIKEPKRPILPIIDPATISSQPEPDIVISNSETIVDTQASVRSASISSLGTGKEEQIKEMNEIEAKIQGLKQKLAEQLDSMSEDEDFLNIRTEAEELMNDFAEDVFQEITQQAPVDTPPVPPKRSPSPRKEIAPISAETATSVETLPQIELKLPKRPVRERLGAREETKRPTEVVEKRQEKADTPERFTPEPMPEFMVQSKSVRSRLNDPLERRISVSDDANSDKSESSLKRLTSKVSVLDNRTRSCASVVRVRPRPRGPAPASSLLLRAVADAHKSLLNIPPKVDTEPQKVKRALVLPMRRVGDPKIVIQVPGGDLGRTDSPTDNISLDVDSEEEKRVFGETTREEYVPASLTMQVKNTEYNPLRRTERTASRRDDSLVIETINIHNPTVDKDKNTQFIVTMDGYHPNAFLAKKLMTEGVIDDEDDVTDKPKETEKDASPKSKEARTKEKDTPDKTDETSEPQKKRLSDASVESDTQVVIKLEITDKDAEKDSRQEKHSKIDKSAEIRKDEMRRNVERSPPVKKRKASPIVFDVGKKAKQAVKERPKEVVKERARTESASSDNHVIVTATNTHKYDALPPLSQAERKLVWCRAFPSCRYGHSCAFQHPRCKFAAACTRRHCAYSHAPAAASPAPPVISSQVVPAANYKSISAAPLPNMCKYYPACANPTCPYFHPKPCRYGPACLNKLECNFYHSDVVAPYAYPL